MRSIYILSEDLNFFFRVNKELKNRNIKSRILNIGKEIPDIPKSVILITENELPKYKNYETVQEKLLVFNRGESFDKYMIKLMAAHKVSINNYLDILFSIDPGTKKHGLAVFLDELYLNSVTYYETSDLMNGIKKYHQSLQERSENQLNVIVKFGKGVLPITLKFIEACFDYFESESTKFLIIDEFKSSKTKLYKENKKRLPKDEASAIFIALREGTEIFKNSEVSIMNQIKIQALKKEELMKTSVLIREPDNIVLKNIGEEILKGNFTLSKSIELMRQRQYNNEARENY